jgi:hypothetical protein
VNTSFNVRGEPIVLTPHDAYRSFMRTEMDVLILGHYILEKDKQPTWPEPKGGVDEDAPRAPLAEDQRGSALDQVYAGAFLPAAERVRRNQYVRLVSEFGSRRTCWHEHPVAQTTPAVFSIPPELDAPTLDPERAAAAITRFWSSAALAHEMRPVIAKLFAIAQRFPDDDAADEPLPR